MHAAGLGVVLVLALGACERVPDSMRQSGDAASIVADVKPSPAPKPSVAAPTAVPAPGMMPAANGKLHWVQGPAPTADVAAVVRAELANAKADGRSLIVEIGAAWCEPCRRFHEAALRGELDAAFPKLTVVSFSIDDDLTREAVASAGYTSSLIPLFALPKPDGTASGKQIQGSVKGGGSVDEITPRLRTLIASS